jgi:hypothetical protein
VIPSPKPLSFSLSEPFLNPRTGSLLLSQAAEVAAPDGVQRRGFEPIDFTLDAQLLTVQFLPLFNSLCIRDILTACNTMEA